MKRLSVPLLKQSRNSCGITALRMVFKYFGREVSSRKIIQGVGGLKGYGVRTIKLADFAKGLGFRTECYSFNERMAKGKAKIRPPRKADLTKFLGKGLPVIIAVRSFVLHHTKPSRDGHFIVLTKYEKGKFWYNDPQGGKRRTIKEEDLLFAWFNNVLDSSAYLLVLKQ